MRYDAFDTETTGFDMFNGCKPFSIISSTEEGRTEYIELGVDNAIHVAGLLMNETTGKVFHNAKFDVLMLNAVGMEVNGEIHDTMIMAHVYNPDEPNKKLKSLAEKYLGEKPEDEKKLNAYKRKHKIKDYSEIPRELLEPYARTDARITMGLFQFYKSKGVLEDPTYKSEIKLLQTLIKMQSRGVLIDSDYCKEESGKCAARIAQIADEILDAYGDINIASNKQLATFLFDEEGLTCTHYSQAGNPVLDQYNLGRYDHPIIPLIIESRQLTKMKNTYLDNIVERCDSEGVIHCDFFQIGAKTGRFSCREPNLQNIPARTNIDVRRAFVCRPDYSNYYFDYSQVELRIFAHYAKEWSMIDELKKENGDLHGMTAQNIFGDEYTKDDRDIAKRLNFGIIYGIGAKRFAETLNEAYPDKDFKYNDAKMFIGKYYQAYPQVRQFTWKVGRAILNRGYVEDVFKRKYTCEKTMTYKATNYLIQGCAAGVLKNAMTTVDLLLRDKKSNILLTIHDELVIEIHKDETDLVPQIKEIMEDHETFRVPILVNIEKTDTNWSDKLLVS